MDDKIALNPVLEALSFKDTLGVIAGDRTLAFRGADSLKLFRELKELFSEPLTREEIQERNGLIWDKVDRLLELGVLVENLSLVGMYATAPSRSRLCQLV